jgi:hypothetical protein
MTSLWETTIVAPSATLTLVAPAPVDKSTTALATKAASQAIRAAATTRRQEKWHQWEQKQQK